LLLLGWACQEHEHIIVLHSGLFQCFRIWLEDGVVEVELLLLLREVGLGVDEGFEIEDGEAGLGAMIDMVTRGLGRTNTDGQFCCRGGTGRV
jgi:hypothetical protein